MIENRHRKIVAETVPDGDASIESGRVRHDPKPRIGEVRLVPDSIATLRDRGFSNDEIYAIVGPRRTLSRRREQAERLSPVESDRVLRLQRIADLADRVFGNHEKAQRWLRKESRALENARPIDLLRSETGAHIVEQELHRIDYGMFA
jgi:putative toxin-antitoxin system antitoxin component (TIGR02293 family)